MRFLVLLMATLALAFAGKKEYKDYTPGSSPFIDLTYTFNNETILWPGRTATFSTEIHGETPHGAWFYSKAFCTSEHTSTHIDAPSHADPNGWSLDQIPLELLIDVPGVLIDVYDKVHTTAEIVMNYAVTREDIIAWEKKNGRIPERALVLIRTGWGSRWPDKGKYYGSEEKANEDGPSEPGKINLNVQLNFPGIHESAAKYLTTERNIIGVGIDTLSIDTGNSKKFEAHRVFGARQVYMLENVANTHLLPPRGFHLWAVPFKIDQGTGSPTRVLARLDRDYKDKSE